MYLVISKEGGVEEGGVEEGGWRKGVGGRGGGERCYTVSHPGYLPNCHFDIHSVFYRK